MPPRTKPENGAATSNSATIATVERAADILLLFADTPGPDLGVTEIADALDLSKAAVHRVLASLRSRGLVDLDERSRRYSLGVAAMRLGLTYLDRIDVRRVGRPFLEDLSARTDETATLSVLLGDHSRIYVDQVTPDREVIMTVTIGEPYPLYAGASSRAFLAFLPDAEIEEYLEDTPLDAVTSSTVVDADALRQDLEVVRRQGWAHSHGERLDGAASVAAPVRGSDGRPVAVLSVCGPAERFEREVEACRSALLETAGVLSRRFGWAG
ncbi:IclR family transcriptional regulator [Mumia zhuanghuii]|uniref:IclR family transcriptional regulator n=2 Tax=Mumia TaxID=1546255 RepID=A0ABW1QPT0_9ACTN|nr:MULTISPECIES: IclR family transcriptional regulator [Mumia]KAA1420510.1 IclR family transcriptional regulator [Mumia zhuanghuii]